MKNKKDQGIMKRLLVILRRIAALLAAQPEEMDLSDYYRNEE